MNQPRMVARDRAVSRRVIFDGRVSRVVDYFGGASPMSGPQAYKVEHRNYVLPAHLHPVDQFQILYGAPGSLFARRPIEGVWVHYADAFTVYGPLQGADPPLRYFTLRAEPTDVTEFLPGARALLRGPGRSLHAAVSPGRSGPATVLGDQRDGLAVAHIAAGPAEAVDVPDAGPVGQYLFVLSGTLVHAGASYPPESIGWRPSGGPDWVATAGDAGAEVLVLTFPRPRPATERERSEHA